MVPWVSIENSAGVVSVSTELKGVGGVFDPANVCPMRV